MAGVNALFLVALGLAIQVLLFYWVWNWEFTWYLPDLAWGFKYYLDMLQTSAFWPLAYLPAAPSCRCWASSPGWPAGEASAASKPA